MMAITGLPAASDAVTASHSACAASGTINLLPDRTPASSTVTPQLTAPQSLPSRYATVAAAPLAIDSRISSSPIPPARRISSLASTVASSGVPISPLPMASTTGTKVPTPNPAPPTDSGRLIPVQPSSTSSAQTGCENPSAVSSSALTSLPGDLSRTNSRATSSSMPCSSEKSIFLLPIMALIAWPSLRLR